MAFRMRPDQPVEAECRRIGDKQLQLALARLEEADGIERDQRVHTARRHIKKLRALIRLVEPRLASGERHTQRRLRRASGRLAPIADGEALPATLATLVRRYPGVLPPETDLELRRALDEREASVRRTALFTGSLGRVARQLEAERARIAAWTLERTGVEAIAAGLQRSVRRGRRAMHRALAGPTARHYSVWRRRVKNIWFQLRLLEACTGGRLSELQQQLERLDGVLGEAQNCGLLADALTAGALQQRRDTARCLQLIRRYRTDLRREAAALAPLVHGRTPQDFVADVRRAWQSADAASTSKAVPPWPRSA